MSIKLMSRVWELDLKHSEQLVLLALADHADDNGRQLYPSLSYLSWKTGYSKRQVQNIMGKLKGRGILSVLQKAHYHRSVRYAMDLRAAPSKPPYSRMEKIATQSDEEVKPATLRVEKSSARVEIHDSRVATAIATKPSEEPSIESSKNRGPSFLKKALQEIGQSDRSSDGNPKPGDPGYEEFIRERKKLLAEQARIVRGG